MTCSKGTYLFHSPTVSIYPPARRSPFRLRPGGLLPTVGTKEGCPPKSVGTQEHLGLKTTNSGKPRPSTTTRKRRPTEERSGLHRTRKPPITITTLLIPVCNEKNHPIHKDQANRKKQQSGLRSLEKTFYLSLAIELRSNLAPRPQPQQPLSQLRQLSLFVLRLFPVAGIPREGVALRRNPVLPGIDAPFA